MLRMILGNSPTHLEAPTPVRFSDVVVGSRRLPSSAVRNITIVPKPSHSLATQSNMFYKNLTGDLKLFAYPKRTINASKALAVSSTPKPSDPAASLNPNPGMLGTTTWKAICAPAPYPITSSGSVSAPMTFSASRKDDGHEWQKRRGTAFGCFERL